MKVITEEVKRLVLTKEESLELHDELETLLEYDNSGFDHKFCYDIIKYIEKEILS